MLTRIIQDMVLEGGKPAKLVAQEVGKPYPTLLREINPYDRGAKVGAESLIPLMRSAGSLKPLEHLAKSMGCLLVPVGGAGATPWQAAGQALEALEESAGLTKTLRKILAQGGCDREDMAYVEAAGNAMAQAVLALVEGLRAMPVVADSKGLNKVA
jgi:hypothetical protein